MLCRITLTGATPLHSALTPHVLADLRSVINDRYPFFFIDDVVNETRAKIDKDAIEKEGLFPAVYLSTMLPVPKLQRRFDEACKEAESLVFDLLSENSND